MRGQILSPVYIGKILNMLQRSRLIKRSSILLHRWESSAPVTGVRSNHAFEERNLFQFLSSSGLTGFSSPDKIIVQQFSHGQSNPTFMVTSSEGKKYTVRKQPPGSLLPGAHAVDREYAVMSALKETNVPIPATRLFCEDKSVIGSPFFVYDFVEGSFFKDATLSAIKSPEMRSQMYFNLFDSLARIHSVDVETVGLGSYGKRVDPSDPNRTANGYIARQLRTWTKQYAAAETEPIPDMQRLIAELPALIPPSAEPHSCLVHGDYRVDNVLFKENSAEVTAVLDWELSTLGDPLADVAYTSLAYSLPPTSEFMKGLAGSDLNGIPTLAESLAIYSRQRALHAGGSREIPSTEELLVTMDFYLAFSLFRSTAILQGVYKRSLMGNASAANASAALHFARDSAKQGVAFLEKYKASLGTSGAVVGQERQSSPDVARVAFQQTSPALVTGGDLTSDRAKKTMEKLRVFIRERVLPMEKEIQSQGYFGDKDERWKAHQSLDVLKQEAKDVGLWNMFLPKETDNGRFGAGYTNLEYAQMAELTGYSLIAPEVFNCSAPDTGNMEVLARYCSPEQQEKWLQPLLRGEIRSCFAMTEPEVASSDATNMAATIRREGDELVLNGSKWWISGAMDPRCKLIIFMGRTHGDLSDVPAHQRHSMVLVPMDALGVKVVRPMHVMGYDDAPHGHAYMEFKDVRVPVDNFVLGEGRGFEIAQGRLGPGRIHHCMRIVGAAERALELMCQRVTSRVAFGKPLAEQGTIQADIANSRVEIDMARLLCLNAAHRMDLCGNKVAKNDIAAIKVAAPRTAKVVIERAIQSHGAMGLSQDTPLAHMWTWARILQFADGPDEVHLAAMAKHEIRNQAPAYRSPRR